MSSSGGLAVAGDILVVVGADPAAGAEISHAVPAGKLWELLSLRYRLVTSAVVANRRAGIVLDDGVNVFFEAAAAAVQAAAADNVYTWAAFGVAGSNGTRHSQPLPALVLEPGYRIRTVTDLLDVGDNYGAPVLLVRERAA